MTTRVFEIENEPTQEEIDKFKEALDNGPNEIGCEEFAAYDKAELIKYIAEKDKEIAGLKDKLRHYPIMVALLEANSNDITKLNAKIKQLEQENAQLKAKLNK